MDSLISFFENYGELIHIFVYLIVAIILLCKTGNKKYLMEVYDMIKHRTNGNYSTQTLEGQSFSKLKPVYRLNKSTNELEQTEDFIDVQEIANSCKDVCMQAVLERFFPTETSSTEVEQQALDLMQDDLDTMRETITLANMYREKFGLDNKMSVSQVFDYVKNQSVILKKKIEEKEAPKNEEEIIEEGK